MAILQKIFGTTLYSRVQDRLRREAGEQKDAYRRRLQSFGTVRRNGAAAKKTREKEQLLMMAQSFYSGSENRLDELKQLLQTSVLQDGAEEENKQQKKSAWMKRAARLNKTGKRPKSIKKMKNG